LPVVVVMLTVLSTSAATSVKSFLCATDTSLPPVNLTKGQNNYLRVNVFRGLIGVFSALALNYVQRACRNKLITFGNFR
jgi:hypothetical protein